MRRGRTDARRPTVPFLAAPLCRNRGLCLRTKNDFKGAIADFTRVIQLSPNDVTALSNRGYAHRKLGNFEAAAADYTAALDLQPRTVRLHNNRGYCLAKLAKYKEAIADYEVVIEVRGGRAVTNHAALVRMRLVPTHGATLACRCSVPGATCPGLGPLLCNRNVRLPCPQLDPRNTHAYHNRGISYDKLGMYEEAIRDFTRVIQLEPNNVNAYFNRGSAYDSIGNYEAAVADYRRGGDGAHEGSHRGLGARDPAALLATLLPALPAAAPWTWTRPTATRRGCRPGAARPRRSRPRSRRSRRLAAA